MPRKKSTIAPATRIRENQRRSRARRKELIEDLHRRLRQYEAAEIQATLAMQTAARVVVWENVRLRSLLVSKGVSPTTIDRYVLGHHGSSVGTNTAAYTDTQPAPARGEDCGDEIGAENQKKDNTGGQAEDHFAWKTSAGALTEGVSEVKKPPHKLKGATPDRNPSIVEDGSGCELSILPFTIDGAQSNVLPTVPDYFCPAVEQPHVLSGAVSMLEMSCETAARIISSLRGNGDRQLARSQLGCEGREHCNVKNIKVLQIMEAE